MTPDRHHLAQALALVRQPNWPAELDQVLADPLRAALVKACAAGLARKAQQRQERLAHGFDWKKRQSGDSE